MDARCPEPGTSKISLGECDAEANWNDAELVLRQNADADVLIILDTCSAGAVMKGAGGDMPLRTRHVKAPSHAPSSFQTAARGTPEASWRAAHTHTHNP